MSTSQTLAATRGTTAPSIRLGSEHGYAFDGDQVRLDADLVVDDAVSLDGDWALQLWACDFPFEGRRIAATKVAEAPLALGAAPAGGRVSASAQAFPPAGRAEHNLVLVLANGRNGQYDQVCDYVNYPRRERFVQPQLDGTTGFSLSEDTLTLSVERIDNPRSADNLSGSLALELWALPAPFSSGEPQGHSLGSVALGSLAGQQSWQDLSFSLPLGARPAGTWQIALLLREWTAGGYVTRDFSNFPLPVTWPAEVVAASPVETPAETPASEPAKPAAKAKKAAATKAPTKAKAEAAAAVSINKATEAELAAVKGLSKVVAAAIVAARPFKTLDDLVQVKGLGAKTLEKLRGSLSL